MGQTLFRKKTMEQISSPEQLSDYLRTANPGIWILLVSVAAILTGLIAWSAAGTIETKADARAVVSGGKAAVAAIASDTSIVAAGMTVTIAGKETVISSIETDEYGRMTAHAEVDLPDGSYDASIITERMHPVSFLFRSN